MDMDRGSWRGLVRAPRSISDLSGASHVAFRSVGSRRQRLRSLTVRKSILSVVVLSTLALLPSAAQAAAPRTVASCDGARVDKAAGVARTLSDCGRVDIGRGAEGAARQALGRFSAALGVRSNTRDLRVLRVTPTSAGPRVRFQQFVNGVPVRNGQVAVALGQGRRGHARGQQRRGRDQARDERPRDPRRGAADRAPPGALRLRPGRRGRPRRSSPSRPRAVASAGLARVLPTRAPRGTGTSSSRPAAGTC